MVKLIGTEISRQAEADSQIGRYAIREAGTIVR